MLLAILLVAAQLGPRVRDPGASDPRAVLREVVRAVETGTTGPAGAEWRRRLAQSPGDPSVRFALASLDRLTYRYPSAIDGYAAVSALPAAQTGRFAAFASLGAAQVLWVTGRYAEAGTRFAAAVEQGRARGDTAAQVLGLVGLAGQQLRTTDAAVAGATFDSAGRLVPADDFQLQAAYRCGRAALLARTARPEAVTEARSGAAAARRAGDARQEAACLLVAANGLARLDRLKQASALFSDLALRFRRLHEHAGLATVLQWHGYVAFTQEHVDEAQRLLGTAILEAETSGNVSVLAWSLLNLAQVSIALSDPISAAAETDRALALLRGLGDQWGVTTALGLQGDLAFTTGDTARAHALFNEVAEHAIGTGDAPAEAEVETSLAALAVRARDWLGAARGLDRARAALLRAGRSAEAAALPYEHGVLALRRNDPKTARTSLLAALAAADSAHRITRYLAESRLAEVHLRLGDTVEAERRLVHASDELDGWRATLSDSTLRVLAFQVSDRFGGEDLGTASVLAAMATSGRLAPAFEIAERRRARDLRDQLLRLTAPTHGSVPRAPRPLSFSAFTAALPDDRTAVLEYVTGRGEQPTVLFALARGWSRAYRLAPLDSLIEPIRRFVALVDGGLPDSAAGARLGELLLAQAAAELPAVVTRLVLLPDDALHHVPFAALRIGGRYVAERYTIELAPSAAVAVTLWGRPPAPGPARVLAFGDPVFPADRPTDPPATRARYAAFAERGGLTRLPASGDEARTAAAFAPRPELRLRQQASAAFLRHASLDSFRIIHLATHAQVDERALGRSAIALAPGGGEDGFVTAGDLASLRLRADLVVLSGCGTALGVIVGGEGIRGLTAPLLQAGARAVLATLWPVADRETARFVADFYRALGRGATAADALRQAQLDAARQGRPPRAWAGFVLTGDGFTRVLR